MIQIQTFYEQELKTLMDHMNDYIKNHPKHKYNARDIDIKPIYDNNIRPNGFMLMGIIRYEE